MPLSELKRFAVPVHGGPGNEADRLALLNEHRTRIDAQMAALEEARDIIAWKTEVYEEKLRAGDTEGLRNPTVSRKRPPA